MADEAQRRLTEWPVYASQDAAHLRYTSVASGRGFLEHEDQTTGRIHAHVLAAHRVGTVGEEGFRQPWLNPNVQRRQKLRSLEQDFKTLEPVVAEIHPLFFNQSRRSNQSLGNTVYVIVTLIV